jgi:N-acylneuraminate cytidylyltransferase
MTKCPPKLTKALINQKPVLCIIPARAGSKRVKNKNVRLLNDIPLIYYSIRTALDCKFNPIIVSTNSNTIANIALHCSHQIQILIRPDSICQDNSTDKEVIDHVIRSLKVPREIVIAYLRPTTPIRDKRMVNLACHRFVTQKIFTALRCVEELTESAYKSFIINNHQLIPIFSSLGDANLPNQVYPKTYRNNGYLDLYRNGYNDLRVMGYITPKAIEIDIEEDISYAEWKLSKERK